MISIYKKQRGDDMHIENEILINDFIWAISEAVELISPVLNNHHKKVAYISSNIAREMGLSGDDIQNIILASMLHDIGVFSVKEWIEIASINEEHPDMDRHAYIGYELLKDLEPLCKVAEIIKDHHAGFRKTQDKIPVGSYIIHLADRLSLMYDQRCDILEQAPAMLSRIHEKRSKFHPDTLAALEKLGKMEYIWFEAFTQDITPDMMRGVHFSKVIVDLPTLREFAKTIAQIIDFRSRFTATHSSGVAAVARELSSMSGFSERECKMMEIAGFLHDLGKMAIPNEILEKKGALNTMEFNLIRKHTYYTYVILNKIRGLENVAVWAANHHERPDGNGYPFHVKDGDFSKLSRIMAVADVVTALTEDRPYREGMDRKNVESILQGMINNNGIDRDIVELASKNFVHINDLRMTAQQEARQEYEAFYESLHIPA